MNRTQELLIKKNRYAREVDSNARKIYIREERERERESLIRNMKY